MVYESCYWKEDLYTYATDLQDFSSCADLDSEYREYCLEKALLLSAFTVRLLLDSNKLSDRFDALNLKVEFNPAKKDAPRNISPWDKRFIDEKTFDLTKSASSSISLRKLTNQLIHSAVIVSFSYDTANHAVGFYVVSDNDYEKRLCYCDLKEWKDTLEAAADDEVVSAGVWKDPATGKWKSANLAASDLKNGATIPNPFIAQGLSAINLKEIQEKHALMAMEESGCFDNPTDFIDSALKDLEN